MATPSLPRDGHAITDAAALQLYIDPLWKLVMAHWLLVIKERDAYLLAVFEKKHIRVEAEKMNELFKVLDVNGDGSIEIDGSPPPVPRASVL